MCQPGRLSASPLGIFGAGGIPSTPPPRSSGPRPFPVAPARVYLPHPDPSRARLLAPCWRPGTRTARPPAPRIAPCTMPRHSPRWSLPSGVMTAARTSGCLRGGVLCCAMPHVRGVAAKRAVRGLRAARRWCRCRQRESRGLLQQRNPGKSCVNNVFAFCCGRATATTHTRPSVRVERVGSPSVRGRRCDGPKCR